ncbi:hypothetical protein [Priestia filamentosa]|uniref:hypothetical protein n=1 Tax=Priestia filamentosa TaxID=1402861 RepID=UPI000A08432C|nr:hypothetical protein [Priestia filamentosa]OXS67240.1 hypothetical protein B1B01_17260 [Priestia filamentosa]SMF53577.1 hypothetical protein SAMN06296056_104244 [Priestia filamentosa]
MNIYEALKQVEEKKAQYFQWKHDIRYDRTIPKKTEEEFLKQVDRKTLNPFIKWEKSGEYKSLILLLLGSQVSQDLQDVYNAVLDKAKNGDNINDFMKLYKEINSNAELAAKSFNVIEEDEEEEDDGLEV